MNTKAVAELDERLDFRLSAAHKMALLEEARRRGTRPGQLVREAIISYFSLLEDDTQSITVIANGDTNE